MGPVCTVEGMVYFALGPAMNRTALSQLRQSGRLDDAFRLCSGGRGPFGDGPAVGFNPVVPSVRIPYHRTRNPPVNVVEDSAVGCLIERWPEEATVVRTSDDRWSVDLLSWARNELSPVSDPERYVDRTGRLTVDRVHELIDRFFGHYRSLLLEQLLRPDAPRVSNAEYRTYEEKLRQRRLSEFGTEAYPLKDGPAETVAWKNVCERDQWTPPTMEVGSLPALNG